MEGLRRVNDSRVLKYATAGLCLYEAGAILTGKAPTVTALQRRKRWLGAALVTALSAHFIIS